MTKKNYIIGLLLIGLIITGCIGNESTVLVKSVETESQPTFIFKETEHDFGLIKQSGGIVSHDFKFTYQGEVPVTVTGTPASCACTEAVISSSTFQQGDSGVLTVNFNPNLHAEPEGRFFKTAMILTDPSLDEQPEVKMWAEINLDLGEEFFELKEPHIDDHEDEHTLNN